jgi:hypothetical protein
MLSAGPGFSQQQQSAALDDYLHSYAGLSESQIASVHSGQAIAKTLHSRKADEILVLGAIYIDATPESYLRYISDFDRLRALPGYLAIGGFNEPPLLSDLRGFTFEPEDIADLQRCTPGDCDLQLPAAYMGANLPIDWSAPNSADRANTFLQHAVLARLAAYRKQGDRALGVYNDKPQPTRCADRVQFLLSYSQALRHELPAFYHYLLSYPSDRPASVQDYFYWSKVKFGLKPTLRVVQVVVAEGNTAGDPAYTIAEKQIYSSHYFQAALDLTFLVRDPAHPSCGFYLVKTMGSEQAGLTGFKGSIVRRVALDRSAPSLQKSLELIKQSLEWPPPSQ